jgi:transcriptional regulator with XRE-family HTH domain
MQTQHSPIHKQEFRLRLTQRLLQDFKNHGYSFAKLAQRTGLSEALLQQFWLTPQAPSIRMVMMLAHFYQKVFQEQASEEWEIKLTLCVVQHLLWSAR